LPAICWKWRKYWAVPYAAVLAVWVLVMVLVPHMLVDTTHIVFTLAFAIVLLKQSNILQRFLTMSVAQDIAKSSKRILSKKEIKK
jgi:Na+/phosphate symporter